MGIYTDKLFFWYVMQTVLFVQKNILKVMYLWLYLCFCVCNCFIVFTLIQFLSKEVRGKTTLIGFIGAPWTLGGYAVEGGHSKLAAYFKRMCLEDAALAHSLLNTLTSSLCVYASHQVQLCYCIIIIIYLVWFRVICVIV